MKRLAYILGFLLVSISMSAQSVYEIDLNEDNHYTMDEEFDRVCRIKVVGKPNEDAGTATLSLAIGPKADDYYLLVFDKSYDYKTLKRQKNPSIRFNKKVFGKKPTTESMENLSGMVKIQPTTNKTVIEKIKMQDEEEKNIRIPVYLAKPKGKNGKKLIIEDLHRIELKMKIHVKKDMLLPKLEKKVKDLKEELNNVTFYDCPWAGKSKAHYKKVSTQQSKYLIKTRSLKDEIQKGRNNYMSSDTKYKKYQELLDDLENVDLNKRVVDCPKNHGKIPPIGPHCEYCRSYRSIPSVVVKMRSLQKLYDNGKDVIKEASGLYNACMGGCPILHDKWEKDSRNANEVKRLYNAIIK